MFTAFTSSRATQQTETKRNLNSIPEGNLAEMSANSVSKVLFTTVSFYRIEIRSINYRTASLLTLLQLCVVRAQEFLLAINITSGGKPEEKLEWAFQMCKYNLDLQSVAMAIANDKTVYCICTQTTSTATEQ